MRLNRPTRTAETHRTVHNRMCTIVERTTEIFGMRTITRREVQRTAWERTAVSAFAVFSCSKVAVRGQRAVGDPERSPRRDATGKAGQGPAHTDVCVGTPDGRGANMCKPNESSRKVRPEQPASSTGTQNRTKDESKNKREDPHSPRKEPIG